MEITRGISSAICLSICPLILGAIAITITLIRSKENTGKNISLALIATSIFVFVCSLFGISSHFSGAPSPLFKPSISSIEGTYSIKNPTLQNLHEEGYPLLNSNSFIKLNSDKTFEVQNMPDIIINEYNPRHIFWSGKGTWDLDFDGLNKEWNITFQFTGDADGLINSYLWISGRRSPFVLYSIIGDPDSHRWIMYYEE
jgi:hypothetical protein